MKGFRIDDIIGKSEQILEGGVKSESNSYLTNQSVPYAGDWTSSQTPIPILNKEQPYFAHSPSIYGSSSFIMPGDSVMDFGFSDIYKNAIHFHKLYRPCRVRTSYTDDTLRELEGVFQKTPYVTGEERRILAIRLNVSETQIKVWFQNRRTKTRRLLKNGENATKTKIPRATQSRAVKKRSNDVSQ